MSRPVGLRFLLVFAVIYLFGRLYPIVRFAPTFTFGFAAWLTAACLLLMSAILLYAGRAKSVGPVVVFLFTLLAIEVAESFNVIRLTGPEGTATVSKLIYILGLMISILGSIHSTTSKYLSAR